MIVVRMEIRGKEENKEEIVQRWLLIRTVVVVVVVVVHWQQTVGRKIQVSMTVDRVEWLLRHGNAGMATTTVVIVVVVAV